MLKNNPHATQICDLTADELEGVPTNNLVCERDLPIFDRLTKNAKWANRKFTAANIKNTMTLKGHAPVEVTANARRAVPVLAARLVTWTAEQLRLKAIKDDEKLQKARNAYIFQHNVLAFCKSWGGPCTSIDELEIAQARDP